MDADIHKSARGNDSLYLTKYGTKKLQLGRFTNESGGELEELMATVCSLRKGLPLAIPLPEGCQQTAQHRCFITVTQHDALRERVCGDMLPFK